MAPIRRYLRITLHSVLEVRIYLDEPSLAETWLLRSRDPILPRVIAAIRPYVIPKLREENAKAKGKGSKKKKRGIKDTVSTDEFEVSIFLTETATPHTLLSKQKTFTKRGRIGSNSSKLGVGGGAVPDNNEPDRPILVEEDDDDEQSGVRLADIPDAQEAVTIDSDESDDGQSLKRKRNAADNANDAKDTIQDAFHSGGQAHHGTDSDDKKKLGIKTTYDGFTIYGRVLCLIVKRKGVRGAASGLHGAVSGSDMMENWVSTQAQPDEPPDLL